jgi:hypothetical protein
MSPLALTRRAALAICPASILVTALAGRSALAQPGLTFRTIRVDVAPLRASAGDPTATWVAQDLPAALAQAQANWGGASAPISVRVDYVNLGPSTGGVCGPSPDLMIGAVTVGGVTRPLRATTNYFPSPVDQAMIERSNRDRVSQLVHAFAYWAVREV